MNKNNNNESAKDDAREIDDVLNTKNVGLIYYTKQPHLRQLLDTRLTDLNLPNDTLSAFRKAGVKTIGELMLHWPRYVETCAKKCKGFGEYQRLVLDVKDLMDALNLPVASRDGLTPTADKLEHNARISDLFLCISLAGSLTIEAEKEYKEKPEKFKNVTLYDSDGRPYCEDENHKRYYMPPRYSDEEFAKLSTEEKESYWMNYYDIQCLIETEDIYMFEDLQIFVKELWEENNNIKEN